MDGPGPATPDEHQSPCFMISRIAKILHVHPQTLRLYERRGLITPTRTTGNTRLYSWQDIEHIRAILHLTRNLGVNLAGVEIILDMQQKIAVLQRDIATLRHHLSDQAHATSTKTNRQHALVKVGSRTLMRFQQSNQ